MIGESGGGKVSTLVNGKAGCTQEVLTGQRACPSGYMQFICGSRQVHYMRLNLAGPWRAPRAGNFQGPSTVPTYKDEREAFKHTCSCTCSSLNSQPCPSDYKAYLLDCSYPEPYTPNPMSLRSKPETLSPEEEVSNSVSNSQTLSPKSQSQTNNQKSVRCVLGVEASPKSEEAKTKKWLHVANGKSGSTYYYCTIVPQFPKYKVLRVMQDF